MNNKTRPQDEEFVDAGRMERELFEPDEEVRQDFAEVARLVSGQGELIEKMRQHHSKSPTLSGGDLDAAWDQADAGEETVGGSSPTPDQDIVDELGDAVGLHYEDFEPLHTTEKISERDRHRWELDPASAEDFDERNNRHPKRRSH